MHSTDVVRPVAHRGVPLWPPPPQEPGCVSADRQFVAMTATYRPSGGIARGDALVRRLEERQWGDCLSLARLIVSRDIFSFEWNETFWVPMFQFDRGTLSVRAASRQVLGELAADFDGWSLALWFAQPNAWLHQRRPVDQLDTNLPQVLEAAQADRFIAAG